eukprot:TRINITY_DN27778_c0_g1_i2.p1 TRINITY_DN27778_c0_g1~~TRINITY_DN27778_c0_g1_i2.p1  ORF type:complete len:154 (-),score=31.46 TRINITY_DN27778_c0_g1_i2:374-835(-)
MDASDVGRAPASYQALLPAFGSSLSPLRTRAINVVVRGVGGLASAGEALVQQLGKVVTDEIVMVLDMYIGTDEERRADIVEQEAKEMIAASSRPPAPVSSWSSRPRRRAPGRVRYDKAMSKACLTNCVCCAPQREDDKAAPMAVGSETAEAHT